MLLSALFIFPRFGLFHLQPALAFASLTIAKYIKPPRHLFLVTCFLLLVAIFWFRHLKLFWRQPTRFFEPHIITSAQNIKTLTSPNQPILFLNSPDQLMVLADRIPPKPWATSFPWYLEIPRIQNSLISAIQTQSVKNVVFAPYQNQGKFVPGSYIPQKLNQFVQKTVEVLANNGPCSKPILYSVGNIDPRFGMSKEQLLDKKDRILYFLFAGKNKKPFGHIGLYRIDYEKKSVELDNIIRGVKSGDSKGGRSKSQAVSSWNDL